MKNKRLNESHIWAIVLLSIFILNSLISKPVNRKSDEVVTVDTERIEAATRSAEFVSDEYLVSKVVDGDTIKVSKNGSISTVRLIGIDTPEIVDPRKPVQCFAKEASEKMKSLVENKTVKLEKDITQGEVDKYKRLLRYVFLNDGTNVNEMMIREGFAHEYTYIVPYKYLVEFKAAEVNARNGNFGLWSPNTCAGKTSF